MDVVIRYEANYQTSGVGFKLHFDNTKLSFDKVSNVSSYAAFIEGVLDDDSNNIIFAWVDTELSAWPTTFADSSVRSENLATVTFFVLDTLSQQV